MRLFKIIPVFTFLLMFTTLAGYSQITVNNVKDVDLSLNTDGISYSLPLTVLKMDIELEKTTELPGPFKQYSKKFLGVENVIQKKSVNYKVLDIDVTSFSIPDKDNSYFIKFNLEKVKDKEFKPPFVVLTKSGFLRAYNVLPENKDYDLQTETVNKVIIVDDGDDILNEGAMYSRKKVTDTIVRKITIDTMTINKFIFRTDWVELSEEERANEAAKQIKNIRENRFNLLTGYHEINFGESIKYMDSELKKLEKQYLELFLGKKVKNVQHITVYFIPNKDVLRKVVYTDSKGGQISVKVNTLSTPPSKEITTPVENALVYRIPAVCQLNVYYNDKKEFQRVFKISQLGKKAAVRIVKASVEFDENSGIPYLFRKN